MTPFPAAPRMVGVVIGNRIRWHRERLGWTQARLGEAVGMRQQRVCRLESGQYTPTLAVLERVSVALGIRLRDLVDPD